MMDIARDPRWGRIAEGAGEDLYLASFIASARVQGFQGGNPLGSESLIAGGELSMERGAGSRLLQSRKHRQAGSG